MTTFTHIYRVFALVIWVETRVFEGMVFYRKVETKFKKLQSLQDDKRAKIGYKEESRKYTTVKLIRACLLIIKTKLGPLRNNLKNS